MPRHPESGRFAFYLMCFLGMVLLPLPWAIFAQIAWRQLRSSDQDPVTRGHASLVSVEGSEGSKDQMAPHCRSDSSVYAGECY